MIYRNYSITFNIFKAANTKLAFYFDQCKLQYPIIRSQPKNGRGYRRDR